MSLLLDSSIGCLVGAAVGDALGGATETALPEEIRVRFGGWVEGIVPRTTPTGPPRDRSRRTTRAMGTSPTTR
ncbi:hypothetical protein GCM10027614_02110 [Micromonospora vulcania]